MLDTDSPVQEEAEDLIDRASGLYLQTPIRFKHKRCCFIEIQEIQKQIQKDSNPIQTQTNLIKENTKFTIYRKT